VSYRCQRCREIVPRGQPVRRHVIKRADGSIERELAVCEGCEESIKVVKQRKSAVVSLHGRRVEL